MFENTRFGKQVDSEGVLVSYLLGMFMGHGLTGFGYMFNVSVPWPILVDEQG